MADDAARVAGGAAHLALPYAPADPNRMGHGFCNPLDDHGDFRHPHRISKATRRRIDARFSARAKSMCAGAAAYDAALAAGQVPAVTVVREIRADGQDTPVQLAAARVHHRHAVLRAWQAGLPVPPAVLASYELA